MLRYYYRILNWLLIQHIFPNITLAINTTAVDSNNLW